MSATGAAPSQAIGPVTGTGASFCGLTETQADAPSSVHASRLSLLSALKLTPAKGSQLSTRSSRAGPGAAGNTAGRPLASQDVKDLQSFCGEKSVQPNTATAAADTLLVCLPAGEPVSAQDVSTATHAILSAPHSQLALSVIQEVSSSAEHAFTVSPNALLDAGPESLNIKSVRTGSYDGPSEVLLDSQSAIAKLLTAVRPAELMVSAVQPCCACLQPRSLPTPSTVGRVLPLLVALLCAACCGYFVSYAFAGTL